VSARLPGRLPLDADSPSLGLRPVTRWASDRTTDVHQGPVRTLARLPTTTLRVRRRCERDAVVCRRDRSDPLRAAVDSLSVEVLAPSPFSCRWARWYFTGPGTTSPGPGLGPAPVTYVTDADPVPVRTSCFAVLPCSLLHSLAALPLFLLHSL